VCVFNHLVSHIIARRRCEKQCAGIRVYPRGTWFKDLKKVSDAYSSSVRFRKFNTLAEAEAWLR
jgi:hypothetical protein